MNKKNALKELVKKLKADVGIVRAFKKDLGDKEDEVGGMMIDDIDKASRIIAELANVEDQRDGETNKVMSNSVLANIHESTAMLRQAAEMRERCEREIARLPYPPNGEDVYMFKMLNRILRGDARKGKR